MKLERTWTAIATTWALLVSGCSSATPVHAEAVTERGGFESPESRLAVAAEEDYCGAEVLRWRYDASTASLQIANARLLLRCCGQRGVQVERSDSVYEVTEQDEPDLDGRCEDRCAFDFAVGIHDVQTPDIYLRLLRDVTDEQGSPSLVWGGPIDLRQGSGAVVLDDTAAEGAACSDRATSRRRRATVAAR